MYKLEGMYAAIPTPFHADESIDYEGMKKNINFLIEQGLHGIVVGGSTGEYTVMSTEERKGIIKAACEFGKGRIDIVAGTGCPRAVDTIELSNYAADCGVDAVLVVTPHYMVMTDDMLYNFYKEVAENVKIGVLVYNFPLATGLGLSPQLIQRIATIDNIIGMKNTDDMDHTMKVIGLTADNDSFNVTNGFDSLALATVASGGDGTIGVIHNIVPAMMEKMDAAIRANNIKEATKISIALTDLVILVEAEPYPGPLKAAYDLMGLAGGVPRRPIAPPSEKMFADMKACLIKLGVLQA